MLTLLASALFALAAAAPAGAEEAGAEEAGTSTTREVVESRLEEMKSQLALDDYTWSQVEMILKSSIRERLAIINRYGLNGEGVSLDNLERADKRAVRRELKDCQENAEKRMKRYLDKEQYKEFKSIQDEIHDELLSRLDAI